MYFKHYVFDLRRKKYRLTVCHDSLNNEEVKFGWALCSPKDHYNRKLGNEIAYQRWESDKALRVQIPTKDLTSRAIRDRIFHLLVLGTLEKFLPKIHEYVNKQTRFV